jgi:uncharacterized membrane protein YkvI
VNILKYALLGIWRIIGIFCLGIIFTGIGYVAYLLSKDIWSLLSAIDWNTFGPFAIYIILFGIVAVLVTFAAGSAAEWLEGVHKGWRKS